ncbi:MAG TPA: A24 family peptidase [Vitreimonas sp.]|nr:A24 family peptidase [Vitreimonas sp.]
MPSPLAIAFAIAGLILGLAADRLATRWPEHDEPVESPPGRRPGWRTVVCGALGAVALGLLPERFGSDPVALALFTAWVATLVVGFAIDLDQRLLPDELTLPVIPIAAVYALSGRNPLVGDEVVLAFAAAIAVPAALYLPSLLFGEGAFGLGDVKLLAGTGLMLGHFRTLSGLASGLIVTGVVLVVLLAARRIGRRSYVPFGPFLILGALYGLLIR